MIRTRRPSARRARRPILELLEGRQLLATFTVSNTDASGNGSLAAAIASADGNKQANTIDFDSSFSTNKTITITSRLDLTDTGGKQTITGPAAGVTISGGGKVGVFNIGSGVTASLSGMTITGGSASSGGGLENYGTATLTDVTVSGNSALIGGGLFNGGTATLNDVTVSCNSGVDGGGGLFNDGGTATLTDVTVSGNSAPAGLGGGLDNDGGTATLNDVTVSGNSASAGGGGLFNDEGTATLNDVTVSGNSAGAGGGLENLEGTASLTDVTVSGNSASVEGGGLENLEGTASLTDVTVSGNSASVEGGGLENYGTASLTDVTVSGNSASVEGGGLENYGTASLTDVTVSGNSASKGGGLYNHGTLTLTLTDTIVAGNGGSDIGGNHTVTGTYNLIGTGGSGGLSNGVNHNIVLTGSEVAGLAPLGHYGGTTQTMALLPGSPAIGKGIAVSGITTDQRGQIRGKVIDIGAVQASLVVESTGGSVVTAASTLTLPGAVQLADQFAGDEITFDPTVFNPAATITLSGNGLVLSNTALTTTITGPAAGVTISGGGKVGVFNIGSGVAASLSGMTITGGSASGGGGLFNSGTATLTDVTVSGNSAFICGGLDNYGTATLNDVTVSGNSASFGGGGGLLNLIDATATLTDVTVSGNSAANGGGLVNYGTATLTDVTVSGNSAKYGGGLFNYGTASLTDVTVSGNSSQVGGGLYNFKSTATLTDTIVAGNGGGDIGGTNVAVSSAYNLIGTGGSGGLSNGVNHNIVLTGSEVPSLAPLGNYGGPTQTMALLPGSPAIGKGIGVSTIATDQRGATRATSGAVDIGAFQDQGYTVAVVSGSGQTTDVSTAFPNALVAALTEDFANDPIPGASLTFTAPASGAGATLSPGSATTNASGEASVTATANATAGSYTVTASATGVATETDFALTNNSTTVPTVTGVSSTTAAGAYGVGSVITITVGWSDTVVVTGSPELALNSGGTATYKSGSGTSTLTFTYTVAAGQDANPLDEASTSALTLSGGTIDDQSSGNAAVLTLPAPGSAHSLSQSNIVIDTTAPTVTGVSSTAADGSYGVGSVIDITVAWSQTVVVTGMPKLALNSGGTASYSSGSGTSTLTFAYTVAAGQSANPLDEASATALTLSGGTIFDTVGTNPNAAVLTLPTPGTTGALGKNKSIVIDTTAPTVTAVSSTTAAGSYGVGSTIDVTVAWSKAVVVTGTPELALNSGGTATYSSGSGTGTLTFVYTVAAGQSANPLDEASATALTLSGGTIFDTVGTNPNAAVLALPAPGSAHSLSQSNIVIDTTAPTVTGVSSTAANGTYGVGAVIDITVAWSTAVVVTGTPELALNSGATASYGSGSGTSTLTFVYTVAAGQSANPLDEASATALTLSGGTILDTVGTNPNAAVLTLPAPGATGSLGVNKDIVINTAVSAVTGVSSTTANGTYDVGASIAITIGFTQAVTVGGSPQLALNSGGTASYSSGSGTNTLTFTYTVAAGQNANPLDEASATALTLNGGSIGNAEGNAVLTVPSPGATGSLGVNKDIVISTAAAAVTGVSSTTPNGTYDVGASITITVGFTKPVTVTGTPQLALNSGGTASYSSGSGTSTLTFTYTVAAGQSANPLDEASATALTDAGGTISNADGNASLVVPAPSTAGALGVNKTIVIDALAPTVVSYSVLFGQESYNLIGSTRFDLPWTITGIQAVFSKPIATGDVNSLNGLTTTHLSGLGTTTLTWTIGAVTKGSFATLLEGTGADALKDAAGTALAGGAGFAQAFNVLYGDVNGDGVVSSADMLTVYDAIGTTYDIFDDLDGDGTVDMTDVQIARSQIGKELS